MNSKSIPFDSGKIKEIFDLYDSPIYVYDEAGIRKTAQDLNSAFQWAKGYKNYFAVKATPTPAILKLLHEEGMGFDCSSYAELKIMQGLGISGNDLFYTSNNTTKEDFELAIELEAVVNIDDLTQVPVFLEALHDRKNYPYVALRYNPGDEHSGNDIIGQPTQAKYGMSKEQLCEAFKMLQSANFKEYGLHTMVASNELQPEFFLQTAKLLRAAKDYVEDKTAIEITFLNLGGGFGIPYQPNEKVVDPYEVANLVQQELGDLGIEVLTENGRFVTGPHGYLVSRVRYVMDKYKKYLSLDASMHNLMRPGMYGAYHHISVLDKQDTQETDTYDVSGSLCENNDKFAIDRVLPQCKPGDVVVIHDVGAHAHAMGSNYNGLLRSGEILLHPDGTFDLIRRAETIQDYFATLIW